MVEEHGESRHRMLREEINKIDADAVCRVKERMKAAGLNPGHVDDVVAFLRAMAAIDLRLLKSSAYPPSNWTVELREWTRQYLKHELLRTARIILETRKWLKKSAEWRRDHPRDFLWEYVVEVSLDDRTDEKESLAREREEGLRRIVGKEPVREIAVVRRDGQLEPPRVPPKLVHEIAKIIQSPSAEAVVGPQLLRDQLAGHLPGKDRELLDMLCEHLKGAPLQHGDLTWIAEAEGVNRNTLYSRFKSLKKQIEKILRKD